MSSFSSSAPSICHTLLSLVVFLFYSHLSSVTFGGGDLRQDFEITWGDGRAQMVNNGQLLTLSLDRASGSGVKTKNEFLLGKFDMHIKLFPRNSAGTVTSFYLQSQVGTTWDEIDFEFLGNLSGDPYTLHTNIITQGRGDREQQFRLWFDPTADFHTYSILWNPQTIIFYVDGNTPIREFKNYESSIGVPFPKNQPMRVFGSLWDGEDWATRGGAVKTNWSAAPFTASFRDYNANACVWSSGASSCGGGNSSSSGQGWIKQELSDIDLQKLERVQKNFMIYNYCTDLKRLPQPECSVTNM